MLAFPERMAKGDVPNVDFLHLYGPGVAVRADGLVPACSAPRSTAERTFGLLQHLAHHLRAVRVGPAMGAHGGDGGRRARGVLRAHADRAHGDGVERRAGPDPVERRVRRPRQCAGRIRRAALVAAGVAGGLAGLALTYRPDLVARRRRWCSAGWCGRTAACGAPVLRRRSSSGWCRCAVHLAIAGLGPAWTGMFVDPVVPSPGRARAPAPAVVVAPRRRAAGDRRDRASVVAAPPPRRRRTRCSCGSSRWSSAPWPSWGSRSWRRRSRSVGARRRAARGGAGIGRASSPRRCSGPDSTHLTWVTCVSWPFAVVVVAEVVRVRAPAGAPAAGARPRRRRRRRAHVRLHVAVHVPLLPAAHEGQPRPRAARLRGQPRRSPLLLRDRAAPRSRRRP